ncbi:hypothetical protein F2Q69_00055451 [Brassica cretica]|uniref:NAC domain-containing protein n=1 Tax=Brassica cretica TaxID=69181 RepID=A0A8S9NA87_BRACR|nr:hypothetical protein F2Q69_00055451 [Brassica cretica]
MGSSSLPPGFRFHPTDEELIDYYLKRKVEGLEIELEVIPVIDLYKFDPWELPGTKNILMVCVQTEEQRRVTGKQPEKTGKLHVVHLLQSVVFGNQDVDVPASTLNANVDQSIDESMQTGYWTNSWTVYHCRLMYPTISQCYDDD